MEPNRFQGVVENYLGEFYSFEQCKTLLAGINKTTSWDIPMPISFRALVQLLESDLRVIGAILRNVADRIIVLTDEHGLIAVTYKEYLNAPKSESLLLVKPKLDNYKQELHRLQLVRGKIPKNSGADLDPIKNYMLEYENALSRISGILIQPNMKEC